MIELFLLILLGLLVGWVVALMADFVPRYTSAPPDDLPAQVIRLPGLWSSLQTRQIQGDALLEVASVMNFVVFDLTWMSIIVTFLLLLTAIDLRYRLIPNVLVYPAVLSVMALMLLQPENLRPALVGGGMAFGVFYLTALLQPGKLGGGDIKLAGLIGLAFGFPGMLWALLVGGMVGAVIAAGLLLSRRPVPGIPYAPFLCLGVFIALLYNPFL